MQIGKIINEDGTVKLDTITPISRSSFGKKTNGSTFKCNTACGNFFLTINKDDQGRLIESFVNTSKNGTCKSNIDGLNRMISLALRSGTKVEEIIDQLKDITCSACTRAKGKKDIDGRSCPDIISKFIEEEYLSNTRITTETIEPSINEDENGCPDCGTKMQFTEGCQVCSNPECGYSKCG